MIPAHTDALKPPRDRFQVAADLCPEIREAIRAVLMWRLHHFPPSAGDLDIRLDGLREISRRMAGEEPPR